MNKRVLLSSLQHLGRHSRMGLLNEPTGYGSCNDSWKQDTSEVLAEALSTACYIINRVYVRKGTTKTPYDMWNGRTLNFGYFHVFGCRCYILNDKDYLGKFDSRSDEGIFLGYSGTSTAYRIFNKRSTIIMESVNVVFDDMSSVTWEQWESDEDIEKEEPRVSDKQSEVSETEDAVSGTEVAVPQQAIQ